MTRRLTLLVCLLFTAIGCSTYRISSVDTTTEYYPPKTSTKEVQYVESNPGGNYVKIGYVTVTTQRRQPLSEVLHKLKYEAAILGGDVITNIQSDSTGFWKTLPAQQLIKNAYIHANIRAEVLVKQ